MSVKLEDLKLGAVLIEERDGAICIVKEIRLSNPTYPVLYYRKQVSGTVYKGRLDSFKAVIGQVDLVALQAAQSAVAVAQVSDQPLFGCPDNLKGLKVGDVIKVRHGFGNVVDAIYGGYNYNRPKYPISYEFGGRRYKGVVAAVVGKAA